MDLADLVRRQMVPEPWSEGEKIPWNDPGFSERMLKEHLSQEHDAASRRFTIIDQHVNWIHNTVLSGHSSRILDLGCGPGLYTIRLAGLGHECVGIDYGPASIAYARQQAFAQGRPCTYRQEDIRLADYGSDYGLVMLIFGEFNVFSPADAGLLLNKARQALADGGLLLLEVHTFSAVQEIAGQSTWYTSASGLFSERPHLCLYESHWHAEKNVTTERWFVIDAETGEGTRHAATMQAYTEEEYGLLLKSSGFDEVEFHASLKGELDQDQRHLQVILARKGTQR